MAADDIQLDLDALAPKDVQIQYKGKLVTVTPPTLEQFAKILSISEEMRGVGTESNIDSTLPIYDKALALIREVVTDFKEEKLNYMQIMAMFKLLGDMASPTDDKAVTELKKRGIDFNTEGTASPKVSTSSAS